MVRWFNPEKGYGFIKVENQHGIVGSKEFFCHWTGIRGKGWRNLKEGQEVNFEIVQGNQGDQVNDAIITAEPPATEVAVDQPAEPIAEEQAA